MRNEWIAMVLVFAALGASPASAGSTADELAQIESEHVVLKARLRMLETRAQMAARQADIERFSGTSGDSSMPTVAGIDGFGGKLRATVLMENGHVSEVKAGDLLPNGMRVVSVRHEGVVVQAPGKKRVRLKPGIESEPRGPAVRVSNEGTAAAADRLAVMPPLPARPGTPR